MRRYRKILLLILALASLIISAQTKPPVSEKIAVTGAVEKPITITIADLKKQTIHDIGDLKITNHAGELRSVAKNLKGVLLTDLLKSVSIPVSAPKMLSEFYIVCLATDDYKVVFSWNELFNSATGTHVFLITEKEGVDIAGMDDRILMVCNSDTQTGRRHVKSINRIVIKHDGTE